MTHGLITLNSNTLLTIDTAQTITGNKEFTGSLQAQTKELSDNSKNVATTEYVTTAISNIDALPDQTNQSGNVLTTDGTSASWVDLNLDSKQNVLNETQIIAVNSGISADKVTKYEELYDNVVGGGRSTLHQRDRERSLQILMRINLLKRLESSVESFRLTLTKISDLIQSTLEAIQKFEINNNYNSMETQNINVDMDDDDIEQFISDDTNMIGNKVRIDL